MITSLRATHAVACRVVDGPAELNAHYAIRRAVFVGEQGMFDGSDLDARDADPATLHVLGLVDGQPAGTVRLYPLDTGRPRHDWQGDRLAVLPQFRAVGLGAPLVRLAVATAAASGGAAMIAHIQPANETFFRRLGWAGNGEPEIYVGRPHLPMRIELNAGTKSGQDGERRVPPQHDAVWAGSRGSGGWAGSSHGSPGSAGPES